MKLSLSLSLSLLMGFVGAATTATAAPVLYNINFTGGIITPTFGQFTYDSAAALGSQFTAFNVVWNTTSFNLTSSANSPSLFGTGYNISPTSATFFALLSGTPQCSPSMGREWAASGGQGGTSQFLVCEETASLFCSSGGGVNRAFGINTGSPTAILTTTMGQFTITQANQGAVPEPSSFSLVLTGCGCAAFLSLMRRRRYLASTLPETAGQ